MCLLCAGFLGRMAWIVNCERDSPSLACAHVWCAEHALAASSCDVMCIKIWSKHDLNTQKVGRM